MPVYFVIVMWALALMTAYHVGALVADGAVSARAEVQW